MNFFNTISSRLVGGLDTTTLNYINKFNVATILDPSGTNIVDYDDISYGSTVFGLNSGNTNNSFLTLENSNGAFIKTSDLLQTPFKGFSIYLKYKVRDLAGDKNHSLNASSTHRLMTTNLWPNFDNWENYTTVNPNVPDPREKPIKAQIPIQPDLPASLFQYYSFTDELQDGTLTSFSKLEEVVPQRAIIAFVGRFSTPNTHWTTSNGPLEIQIVEPMPDACGGKLLGSGTPITAANAADDTITAIGCNSTWDNNWVTASPQYTQFTVSETDNGQPNTYYRPGYYFRYYLEGVQGVIVSLLMDSYGGHTQPDGDWHFHLASEFNSGYENCVIGYAVDGVPVMATGSTAYNESNVSLGVAQSKWIRRTDYSDPYSQDGNGYYHYDYVYDYSGNTSTGNLDHFNGAYATIDGVLTYCYFITTDYPIWPRNVRGKVINLVPDTSVFSQYGGTNTFVKLTSTHTEVENGDNLQITVLQNGYNDLSYSITGVTSENLGGADLNGSISGLYNVLSYDIQSLELTGNIVFTAGNSSLNMSYDIRKTFGMITNPGGNAVQIDNVRTDLIAGVDFTIEFFVNISSSSSGVIFGANASQWYEDMLIYYYAPSGDMLVRYYWNGGDGASMNYTGPILSLNQWHHFAVVRHNDIASLYVDGVKIDHNSNDSSKHTMTNSTQTLDSTLYLFKFWDSTYTGIIGSMASVRISKKAVYTGNFTAPTPELSTTQEAGTNIQSLVSSDVVLLVKADPLGNNNVINESQYSATITEDAGITTTLNQEI